MPSFKDSESREWHLRIDVDAIRRIRSNHSIDLATILASPESIDRLTSDICLTIDVIYELCRPAADRLGIDAAAFGRSLFGDSLGHAVRAFEEALVEFLPESGRRATARRIIDAGRALQEQTALRINNAINGGLLERGIQDQLTKLDQQLATMTPSQKPSLDTGLKSYD